MVVRSTTDLRRLAATVPDVTPSKSQRTAPPIAKENVTGRPWADQRCDWLGVGVRITEVAVEQSNEEAAVLRRHGPIEAEVSANCGHGLWAGLPTGDQPRHVVWCDEIHDKNHCRHGPHHKCAERRSPGQEAPHYRHVLGHRSERSRASRTESPSRLNARVVKSRAAPGKTTNHQATEK